MVRSSQKKMAKQQEKGMFAGGNAVNGSSTVISALDAGKIAAQAIDEYLKVKWSYYQDLRPISGFENVILASEPKANEKIINIGFK
ncbi:MAG: hypothetical protein OIN83_03300 [Candidatus Methanoperedens sp.]|nr:hypothetical protein [Candidatus Methanoperedens sp.]